MDDMEVKPEIARLNKFVNILIVLFFALPLFAFLLKLVGVAINSWKVDIVFLEVISKILFFVARGIGFANLSLYPTIPIMSFGLKICLKDDFILAPKLLFFFFGYGFQVVLHLSFNFLRGFLYRMNL